MRISAEKVRSLAKPGHTACLGRGLVRISGHPRAAAATTLCQCVMRKLRRQGVNVNSDAAMEKVVGVDPAPVVEVQAEPEAAAAEA